MDIPAEIARRQDRLDAIAAARTRLEQRQRDADLERGRSDDDDQKPRGKDGKPKPGGRYKRPFGIPADKTQGNFTDPDSRIMQRAGGGFDPAYNAQTAVDDTAHIIVADGLVRRICISNVEASLAAPRLPQKRMRTTPNSPIRTRSPRFPGVNP